MAVRAEALVARDEAAFRRIEAEVLVRPRKEQLARIYRLKRETLEFRRAVMPLKEPVMRFAVSTMPEDTRGRDATLLSLTGVTAPPQVSFDGMDMSETLLGPGAVVVGRDRDQLTVAALERLVLDEPLDLLDVLGEARVDQRHELVDGALLDAVAADDAAVAASRKPRGQHEVLVACGEELAAHCSGEPGPAEQGVGHEAEERGHAQPDAQSRLGRVGCCARRTDPGFHLEQGNDRR